MKKVMMLFVLLFVGTVLSGCVEQKEDLEYILDKGTFVLGYTDFPPMGYQENGVPTGFDIEIAQAVMDRLGVELVFRYIDWSAKELELKSRKVDAVWNGMTITEERKLEMTFSKPYFDNQLVILSRKDNPLLTIASLANKNVGVELSSSADASVTKNTELANSLKDLKKYNTSSDALLALLAGQIDALVVDEIYARFEVLQKTSDMYVIGTEALESEKYGIGYRLGDIALRDRIDEILDQLQEEGVIEQISIKYFGENLFRRSE
jgi:polar amino acid transport system substrate-binding protein